jgi:hypothetical protein
MSDINRFQLKSNAVTPFEGKSVAVEKSMQTILDGIQNSKFEKVLVDFTENSMIFG